jgi:hypothetical protein
VSDQHRAPPKGIVVVLGSRKLALEGREEGSVRARHEALTLLVPTSAA